mgnify:CR=1 FL=1
MSTTTSEADDETQDVWKQLEKNRDVFETIVSQDGPYAPHAENLLIALDERQEVDDDK